MNWVGGGQSHCVIASHNVSNMLLIGNYNEKTSPQLMERKKMSKRILLSVNSWLFFIPRCVASCCLSWVGQGLVLLLPHFALRTCSLDNRCPVRVQEFENKSFHNLLKIGDGIISVEKAAGKIKGKGRNSLIKLEEGSKLITVQSSHCVPIDITCAAFLWQFLSLLSSMQNGA